MGYVIESFLYIRDQTEEQKLDSIWELVYRMGTKTSAKSQW